MKVSTKKTLCVVSVILSSIAFLLEYATLWLARGGSTLQWVYLDVDLITGIIPGIIAIALTVEGCFRNLQAKKINGYFITSAVFCAVPAIIVTVLLIVGDLDRSVLIAGWRLFPATGIYYAVAIMQFVIAFTKTKSADKKDETIPYSD